MTQTLIEMVELRYSDKAELDAEVRRLEDRGFKVDTVTILTTRIDWQTRTVERLYSQTLTRPIQRECTKS